MALLWFKSWLTAAALGVISAQGAFSSQSAWAQVRAWVDPDLLAKAKAEGTLTVYGSMNEQEALPFWKLYTDATGIKVDYIRSSDTGLLSRIAVESRAGQSGFDVIVTTAVSKLPDRLLKQFDLKDTTTLMPQAIDKNRRWYGVYANYNTPQYNTRLVDGTKLPKTFEEFAARGDLAGKAVIDPNDSQWIYAMFQHYGETKARKLIGDLMTNLKIIKLDGHLALARAIGLGEYAISPNNYTNLVTNVSMAGNPTDWWVIEPIAVFFGQVGISAQAPHPNAALLAANFTVGIEAQQQLTKAGRIPVRRDVTPAPSNLYERFGKAAIITVTFSPEDEKKWKGITQQLLGR